MRVTRVGYTFLCFILFWSGQTHAEVERSLFDSPTPLGCDTDPLHQDKLHAGSLAGLPEAWQRTTTILRKSGYSIVDDVELVVIQDPFKAAFVFSRPERREIIINLCRSNWISRTKAIAFLGDRKKFGWRRHSTPLDFILLHELSHIIHKDQQTPNDYLNITLSEVRADTFALRYLDPWRAERGLAFLKRLYEPVTGIWTFQAKLQICRSQSLNNRKDALRNAQFVLDVCKNAQIRSFRETCIVDRLTEKGLFPSDAKTARDRKSCGRKSFELLERCTRDLFHGCVKEALNQSDLSNFKNQLKIFKDQLTNAGHQIQD